MQHDSDATASTESNAKAERRQERRSVPGSHIDPLIVAKDL
jgi:hypothetical protein